MPSVPSVPSVRAHETLRDLRSRGIEIRLQPRYSARPSGPPPSSCPSCQKSADWLALSLPGRFLCGRCYRAWGTPIPTFELDVRAPVGVITPDLAASLRAQKPALVELLKTESGVNY